MLFHTTIDNPLCGWYAHDLVLGWPSSLDAYYKKVAKNVENKWYSLFIIAKLGLVIDNFETMETTIVTWGRLYWARNFHLKEHIRNQLIISNLALTCFL
jgi:hypothetical protein